jgi:hypothetical protein
METTQKAEKTEAESVVLSTTLKEKIEQSTIKIMTHRLYMRYWQNNLQENLQDPEYKNQAIFFWSKDEPFEKKSLPPVFTSIPVQHFFIKQMAAGLELSSGEVIPWFGMPGGGQKYFFKFQEQPLPLNLLFEKGILQKIELIQLKEENSSVLQDREQCYFVMDPTKLAYRDQAFYHEEKEISISDAYEKGLLTLIRVL